MLFCLNINEKVSLDQAWISCTERGIEVLYGTTEENGGQLFIHMNEMSELPPFEWIVDCHPYTLPAIDWEAQWEEHGMDYREGKVHVSFDAYDKKWKPLVLKPGPGFGDLSHPTTRLTLDLMARYLNHEVVIDIGCGSGVLSLAACSMGAASVHGIDIDPEALTHSQENAILNGMENQCYFSLPKDFTFPLQGGSLLTVMNMISSEQKVAWSSLPTLHSSKGLLLTAGIRKEEREAYFQQTQIWGCHLLEEVEQEGWLAFCFKRGI